MYKLPMCRICLIKDVRMHCLVNTQLQEIYELLSGNLLETKDTRPLHACYMCCARLRNCLRLRTACLHSEELFSHLLENSSCEVTPSQDINMQQTGPAINMIVDPEIHRDLKMDPLLTPDELHVEHVEDLQDNVIDQEISNQFIKEEEIKYENVYSEDDNIEYSVQNIRVQVHSPSDNCYSREGTQESYISKSNHSNSSANSKDILGDKTVKIELQRIDLNSFGKSATVTEHLKPTDVENTPQSTNLNNCENVELLKPVICEEYKEIVQTPSGRPNSNAFKIYKCNICDKRFSKKGVLKVHYSIHSGVRPYKCDTCGKGFIQKCHLKHHIRIHTGDKPYKCDTCGICFIYNSSLLQHIRTHTGEKPYKCNICGRRFNRKYALTDHTRTHNSEKPYKCDMCGKYFSKKYNLSSHIRKHTGEKPYKCDTCGKCYCQKYSLSIHACSDRRKPICLNYNLDNEIPHD